MNKKYQGELNKLRKRWNINCKTAQNNLVAYVLKRSRANYLKVVGSEIGLEKYQAEVLNEFAEIGTHKHIARRERGRVATIVREAFSTVEPDTVTGMIGIVVVNEVLGDVVEDIAVYTPEEMIITQVEDRTENFNPHTGIVPGPVSAMSSVSMQGYQPLTFNDTIPQVNSYVVDPTSPINIYPRDVLKNMGLVDSIKSLVVQGKIRQSLENGLKKVHSLNWRKVGAMIGSMAAVSLVSLGTSVSAYATATSEDTYYMNRNIVASSVENPQSIVVSPLAAKPELHDRMDDIYLPDMIWPTVDGAGVFISSGFGYRSAPCAGCSTDHRGLDMNPGYGTEVYSATDGTVVSVGWDGGLGWNVLVQDGGNREYAYGHMIANSSPADIYVGAEVKQGQVIGQVGCTGLCTGPHLHFEIRENGVKIDPLPELLRWAH